MADKDRIPADEALDARPWNLPYWQGAPVLKQPLKKPPVAEPIADETADEEFEIEVEPLTAEQLEEIRRDAYNEGLEQGLVEGRQKGEKLGYDKGFEQGKKEGYGKGFEEGKEAGFNAGEKKAEREGKLRTDEQVKQLTAVMFALLDPIDNQQAELTQTVHDLVMTLTRAVVGQELNQGSEHILTLVGKAVKDLPLGSQNIRVYVHSVDFPYLEEAARQTELNWKPSIDDSLEPGGCRLQTEYSLVDYTRSERLEQIFKAFEHGFAETHDMQVEENEALPPADAADNASLTADSEMQAPIDDGLPVSDQTAIEDAADAADPLRARHNESQSKLHAVDGLAHELLNNKPADEQDSEPDHEQSAPDNTPETDQPAADDDTPAP
jgi:flagellar assembly protein FliH